MPEKAISSIFDISPRFLRSVNLERDILDPQALDHYVLTPHARHCLGRIAKGLRGGATDRAWRLTGTYGSGKSSFALVLAHWFSGNTKIIKKSLGDSLNYETFGVGSKPAYTPVLVTGSREPLGRAILRAVLRVMDDKYTRGARSSLVTAIATAVERGIGFDDSEVAEWVVQCNAKLIKDGKTDGMLILLDELGKFLEYAAFHPQKQDVYLLQKLGEAAAASGEKPIFLIGLLHQGFTAYADNLDQTAQREWEKISGRFEEIIFSQPLAQIAQLIIAALHVREHLLLEGSREELRAGMDAALRLGWLGASANHAELIKAAPKLFPLHATVLPALIRAFSKFGQNERSLFSFLLSHEPFALQDFAEKPLAVGNTYRLPDFYDYMRTNFQHRFSARSYRSHWSEIQSMVDSFATSDPVRLKVVKTVGILNLLDEGDLPPTEEALEAALCGTNGIRSQELRAAIHDLHKSKRILYRRGVSGAYCLWPHTSVDLEAAYEKATKAIGHLNRVGSVLKDFLVTRPIVARRHYIQTGNLRYFDVRYCPINDIDQFIGQTISADGTIIVVLCETHEEGIVAERYAKGLAAIANRNVLIGIPNDPLMNHAGLVADALRWDWVALNTPELNGDRFAREEVTRQKQIARERLDRRIQDLLGLRSLSGGMALRWFRGGEAQPISCARDLLGHVSLICDDLFKKAPLISNELVNRRIISSAAAAARMRLIERLFSEADKAVLGMDPEKKPPEMSMYLSILKNARIHIEKGGTWRLAEPSSSDDPCRVGSTFQEIRAFLEERGDVRRNVSELFSHLGKPPLGVRLGLAPLFLALYAAIHPDDVAFYEDNSFLPEVRGDEFMRMTKAPETFEIQLCRIMGLRSEIFESLLKALDIASPSDKSTRVVDVVRSLCQFVARLPDYARKTRRLSPEAIAVREVILGAKDPVKLLFHDLPIACALKAFPVEGMVAPSAAKQYARSLRSVTAELRDAAIVLHDRIRNRIRDEFNLLGRFAGVRERLAIRAEPLVIAATEPRLKALCLRFIDRTLSEDGWLESLGSLVVQRPPSRWSDSEEDIFNTELSSLGSRFRNLESIVFKKGAAGEWAEAFRLALTKEDGSEAQEVVFVEKDEQEEVDKLVEELQNVLGKKRHVGMAALSKVAWRRLGKR